MLAYRLLQAQTQPELQEVPEPHAGPGQVVASGSIALMEVVEMAALGRLKVLADRYPLSAAKQAYDDFEHGRLVGRAVLMPAPVEAPAADATNSSRVAPVSAGV